MTNILEENCPACIVDAGLATIMQARVTTHGFVWHCPICGTEFTEEDLDRIYKTEDNQTS